MLVTFESTVCTEGNEFDESGWAEVVKESTQSPIDAGMPYSSNHYNYIMFSIIFYVWLSNQTMK